MGATARVCTSDGVMYPRVLRGRSLSSAATANRQLLDRPKKRPSTPFLEVVAILDGHTAHETTFLPGSIDSCVVALDVAAAAQRGDMHEGVAALHVARAVIIVAVRLERDSIELLLTVQAELRDTAALGIRRDPDPADPGALLAAALVDIRASGDLLDPAILRPTLEGALLDHAATRITIVPPSAAPRFWPGGEHIRLSRLTRGRGGMSWPAAMMSQCHHRHWLRRSLPAVPRAVRSHGRQLILAWSYRLCGACVPGAVRVLGIQLDRLQDRSDG